MHSIPLETLAATAKQAAGEFLSDGTDLSTAVIKAASLLGQPLTDAHVRRICEMATHEAFEQAYHAKEGTGDRYVSFDPPDPVYCASELKAVPVHTSPDQATHKHASALSLVKAAAAPREKFVPRDPIERAFPSIQKVAENWESPLRELCDLQSAAKAAVAHLAGEVSRAESSAGRAMDQLAVQAEQACKEGAAIPMVLHVCTAGMDDTLASSIASDVLRDVGTHLFARGYVDGDAKLASTMVPNPEHPLATLFFKVASLRTEREHLVIALSEARSNYDEVSRKIAALCH